MRALSDANLRMKAKAVSTGCAHTINQTAGIPAAKIALSGHARRRLVLRRDLRQVALELILNDGLRVVANVAHG